MAGSSAVIGLPSDGTVLKYDLTDAATLMSDDRQTLSGTSLEVVSGEGGDGAANMVVMEFVKLLVEDGEVPISEYGNNNFIHARGTSELGYHTGRFAFVIDFGDEVAVSDDVTSDETVYDAIVIGAGWAGIRAIETLASEGVSKFLVLEATDRVGGRCRTESWGDGTTNDPNVDPAEQVYDLGADWLYSGTDMSDALDDGGYLDDAVLGGPLDTSMPLGLGYGTFYRQYKNDDDEVGGVTAEALDDAVSSENMDTLWGGFHEFRDNRLDEMGGMSYEEAIDWYIQRWGYTDDEALDFLDLIEASVEVENAGDSSMLDINEIKFFPPGYAVDSYYMSVPGAGFGNIAARYAAQYSSSIRLNSRVVDVDSEAEPDVAVVTYVGEDGVTRVVKAKTVLVTVSLGVLKAGTVNFVPALPENKLASIEAMGFGTINKCILSWNDDAAMVWPEDEMWFMLITPDEETSGRWTTFFNPSSLKGKPSLTSFVAGEDAVAMEGQSDEEVLEDVMTNLRSMFPDISDPDRVIVTRWGVEEDFMGAHSYPVPGRDIAEDAANLSETYGRIYFAGEATGNRWGTTLGAWNTGEEQALAMAQRLMGG
ncbi:hypothetical protein ACHAW5_010888 [Stephanodiscus triporus]|uniref:Amine oxidase domain-containing protein n=1 Tax=Stephanodiscus triporus TaxID=2934178 RepID=A0ABD3P825_9STRA